MYFLELPLELILMILAFLSTKEKILFGEVCKILHKYVLFDPIVQSINSRFYSKISIFVKTELFFRAAVLLNKEVFRKYLLYNPHNIDEILLFLTSTCVCPITSQQVGTIRLQKNNITKIKQNLKYYFENTLKKYTTGTMF